jgi:hypothetical protein
MHVRGLVLVPLAVLLTGCAALSGTASKPGRSLDSVVPWMDAKPTTMGAGLATPVDGNGPRACQRKDLHAIYGGATGPVRGRMTAIVDIVNLNQDQQDCVIQGMPAVVMSTLQGVINLTQVSTSSVPPTAILLNPAAEQPKPFSGKAGGAWLEIGWKLFDQGSAKCSGGLQYAAIMQLTLRDSTDAIPVDYFADKGAKAVAVCPPTLEVGAFQPVVAKGGQPVLSPRYWKYTIDAPATATAGQPMKFRITLQNVYYRALQFEAGCPDYEEDLQGPNDWTSGKIFYVLNCESIGVVNPAETLTFAMQIDIPADLSPGSYTLGWDFDTGATNYGAVTSPFTVS